jgi:hypothetical protein
MWQLHPLVFIAAAAGLILAALAVFGSVRRDYRVKGRLSPMVSGVQFGFFCVYALFSYVFLDSRVSSVRTTGGLFLLSIILMSAGFAAVLFSMPALGRRSFGHEVGFAYVQFATCLTPSFGSTISFSGIPVNYRAVLYRRRCSICLGKTNSRATPYRGC